MDDEYDRHWAVPPIGIALFALVVVGLASISLIVVNVAESKEAAANAQAAEAAKQAKRAAPVVVVTTRPPTTTAPPATTAPVDPMVRWLEVHSRDYRNINFRVADIVNAITVKDAAALAGACRDLLAAVQSAQAGLPVPDRSVNRNMTAALTLLRTGAEYCAPSILGSGFVAVQMALDPVAAQI